MPVDIASRLDFLVSDIARLNGRRFDRLARERLGLSRAQCRLLVVLSMSARGAPLNQATLAEHLDMTPMAVAKLCERMQAAGWIEREGSTTDRRAKLVKLAPDAGRALSRALRLADQLQDDALAGITATQRKTLLALLQRVHANVGSAGAEPGA
jgi:DNA-binding MarR family transcriptional regulator